MKTKEEIKNHPGFKSILEKAKSLDPKARERLIKMFRNDNGLAFLSGAEQGVTLHILRDKIGSKAMEFRGDLITELNHNRDLMVEILENLE